MTVARLAALLLPCIFLSGCALKKSIQQRISVSEQCRVATSTVPSTWNASAPLASLYAGKIGTCSITGTETLMPMCSLEQIGDKFGLLRLNSGLALTENGEAIQKNLDALRTASVGLRKELEKLASQAEALDGKYIEGMKKLKGSDYGTVTAELLRLDNSISGIPAQILSVRNALEKLRTEVASLETTIPRQASIELAAWDANLRAQLAQLERLLAGDIQLILRAGLRDQVLTHVARRSLEMLHGALKPADAVLNKLDERAYGAVSVSYLMFSPNLQDAVDNAMDEIKSVYRRRKGLSQDVKAGEGVELFLLEIRRAACENLVQGSQFTMLTELVDTMLITRIEDSSSSATASPPAVPVPQTPEKNLEELKKLQGQSRNARVIDENMRTAGFSIERSGRGSSAESTAPATESAQSLTATRQAVKETSPFAVYMANEWMARQQMLVQKITSGMENTSSDAAGNRSLRGIISVDEASVRQLADAATATVVDEAAFMQPALLTGEVPPGTVLSNYVTVAASSAAVSSASIALKVNLSVSNVNTFNPTNHIAPVINLPAPVNSERQATLCEHIGAAAYGASCSDNSNGYFISFNATAFRSDSCDSSDLQPALGAVGRAVAAYRARNGIQYDAVIHGFASLPSARMAKCRIPQNPSMAACRYTNQLRNKVEVQRCMASNADRNTTLSAARAGAAAAALEGAAQGAITVGELIARGTETVPLAPNGRPASADQTVLIHLIPRTAR